MSCPPSQAVEAIYATGHWLLTSQRYKDAAIVFRAMAQAAPSDERSWLGLGACHEGIGQLRIAAELYRLAGEVVAAPIRATIARGRVLRQLGLDDQASEEFERAREIALDADETDLAQLALAEGRAS